mgnify:CR=1 FL=1
MKYKDLNIGDWFSYAGATFIKTYCPLLKANYDICVSGKMFGAIFAPCDMEDEEVEFVSRLTVENPIPFKTEADETLFIAPTFQFLSWQSDNREIILMKALIQGEIYMLTINGNTAGVWTKAIPRISVKVIPRIDLKYEENS